MNPIISIQDCSIVAQTKIPFDHHLPCQPSPHDHAVLSDLFIQSYKQWCIPALTSRYAP